MRLRQDGHEDVGLVGPPGEGSLHAWTRTRVMRTAEAVCRHLELCQPPAELHLLAPPRRDGIRASPRGLTTGVQGVHAWSSLLHAALQVTSDITYTLLQSPDLEIVALTEDHASFTVHHHQYVWAPAKESAAEADPSEICLDAASSGDSSSACNSLDDSTSDAHDSLADPADAKQPPGQPSRLVHAARAFLARQTSCHQHSSSISTGAKRSAPSGADLDGQVSAPAKRCKPAHVTVPSAQAQVALRDHNLSAAEAAAHSLPGAGLACVLHIGPRLQQSCIQQAPAWEHR